MTETKILLVDDDPLVLKSLSTLLQREGYQVWQANSGIAAVGMAKETFFDLVITDVRMAGKDGLQTVEEIQNFQRQTSGQKPSRFMIMTGFTEDEAPQRAIDLQITEFLIKPFDASRFIQAIRDQFREGESHRFALPSVSFIEKVKPAPLSMPNLKKGAFHFEKVILLKDTNLMGNTYFANYVLWQGEVREVYLLSHPRFEEEFSKNQHIKMVTHSLYHRFVQEATFGDTVEIRMTSREVKRCSFVLVFRYYHKKDRRILRRRLAEDNFY